MKYEVINNSLNISFDLNEPLNPGILEEAQEYFKKLDQFKPIILNLNGYVPIELLSYYLEVSKYCDLTVQLNNDIQGMYFMNSIKDTQNLNIKIKGPK